MLLEEWEVYPLFDLQIFLRGSMDKIVEQLAHRHLEAGIVASFEDGIARANGNDRSNGEYL